MQQQKDAGEELKCRQQHVADLEELVGDPGPYERALEEYLQTISVARQAYYSGAFVGNHVMKCLEHAKALSQVRGIGARRGFRAGGRLPNQRGFRAGLGHSRCRDGAVAPHPPLRPLATARSTRTRCPCLHSCSSRAHARARTHAHL